MAGIADQNPEHHADENDDRKPGPHVLPPNRDVVLPSA
jgi:hypothetical protein